MPESVSPGAGFGDAEAEVTETDTCATKKVFREAAATLQKTGVFFWLDQGSLLGCIRDRQLIAWDHDIDFGVWKDQANRELLISHFEDRGFRVEDIPREMDCIHFLGVSGKKVDITFYQKDGSSASTKWVAPKGGLLRRLIRKIEDCLEQPGGSKGGIRNNTLKLVAIDAFSGIVRSLPDFFREWMLSRIKPLNLRYPSAGIVKWHVPLDVFGAFKEIHFLGVGVHIPAEPEKYLSFVYGPDWRIPKRKWDWWKECGGLEAIATNEKDGEHYAKTLPD